MNVSEQIENPYIPEPARIVRHYDLIKDHRFFQVRHLDMKRAMSFTYSPGQFLMVSIPGVGEAPFSISSTPSRPGILELGVRKVGKVTESFFQLRDNDQIYIRGPYGNGFKVDQMMNNDVIIVAGGLGVIPLRSILYYILDNRDKFGQVFFLYGARNPDEILFKTEFFQLKKRQDLMCLCTVDKPDATWTENVGVVTTLFSQLPEIDPKRTTAVVVGPPVMYKFVIDEFLKLKIPKNQIQLSLERRMKCGIGKCGHCALDHLYTCIDGPVFTYWDTLHFRELI
ncbi:MAG: FAD/NAD(P)-binding protein [Candidatus Thorarchaeota archaeon]|nr:MAG: oxidoreductase [Candidatus Thorarchaeota archaeon]RLI58661.1 MAG: oxidoreductase [Candidatus Thorarchaeota archaeon]